MKITPLKVASVPGTAAHTCMLPLCVELDGTLLRSNTLTEAILELMPNRRLPSLLLRLPVSGIAAFKHEVARLCTIDPALLPYNQDVIDYLRRERAAGRMIVMATRADHVIAQAVADHLGLFDDVIASDGMQILAGTEKAAALCRRFGHRGFIYAGHASSDGPVWQAAAGAVLVDVPRVSVAQQWHGAPVEAAFKSGNRTGTALLRAMRPHHWVKNLLVFVPIFTAHVLSEPFTWAIDGLVFLAFCAMASAIYLLNDLTDLTADRRHPRKRFRAFASGELSPGVGITVAAFLVCLASILASSCGVLLIVLAYAGMSISYSLALKQQPLVDVFMLAGLYTIRMFAGGAAIGHALSLWLLGFSSFLFLSLALLKRVEELTSLHGQGNHVMAPRRGYMPSDAATLQLFGCASAFASGLVLALFVQREATADNYALPGLLWMMVPLVLFWQCRLWLSTSRGYMHDDPIIYAAHDWVSWVVGICVLGLLVVARSNPFGLL